MQQIGFTLDGRTLCSQACHFGLSHPDKLRAGLLFEDGNEHTCECGKRIDIAARPPFVPFPERRTRRTRRERAIAREDGFRSWE